MISLILRPKRMPPHKLDFELANFCKFPLWPSEQIQETPYHLTWGRAVNLLLVYRLCSKFTARIRYVLGLSAQAGCLKLNNNFLNFSKWKGKIELISRDFLKVFAIPCLKWSNFQSSKLKPCITYSCFRPFIHPTPGQHINSRLVSGVINCYVELGLNDEDGGGGVTSGDSSDASANKVANLSVYKESLESR